MICKILGAGMILCSCTGYGFFLASRLRREETALTQLAGTLEWMICELEYRQTPLPELCTLASGRGGILEQVFFSLGAQLDQSYVRDAAGCMERAIEQAGNLPPRTGHLLWELGRTLGKFDLKGQILGLQSVHALCVRDLGEVQHNLSLRLRGYRTLGICACVALVIILL